MADLIEHVFVLLLDNRAFDHILGFSGITGQDAASGGSTQINGLTGNEANAFSGRVYQVTKGADNAMPARTTKAWSGEAASLAAWQPERALRRKPNKAQDE